MTNLKADIRTLIRGLRKAWKAARAFGQRVREAEKSFEKAGAIWRQPPRPRTKFAPGQEVRHRTSGEIGIVTRKTPLSVVPDVNTDHYDISFGFNKYDHGVPVVILKPVDESPKELPVDPFDSFDSFDSLDKAPPPLEIHDMDRVSSQQILPPGLTCPRCKGPVESVLYGLSAAIQEQHTDLTLAAWFAGEPTPSNCTTIEDMENQMEPCGCTFCLGLAEDKEMFDRWAEEAINMASEKVE